MTTAPLGAPRKGELGGGEVKKTQREDLKD